MMDRQHFLRRATALSLTGFLPIVPRAMSTNETPDEGKGNDRPYWVQLLQKISAPVLENMSRGEMRKRMPMQYSPTWDNRNREVAYMEAFGRLIAGLAPFLALPADGSAEGKIRGRLLEQTRQSLEHAVDPKSPDYLYWGSPESRQPLVDAAYIAQALLAAPAVLWEPLPDKTKQQFIHEFIRFRQIRPYNNNWVLFAAMIETFLLSVDVPVQADRIDGAIDTIQQWYAGDGWYKDGQRFHFDHYNGYVIQPMLCEVLRVNAVKGRCDWKEYEQALLRMQRYAHFQERLISPEGYYPVIGRSSTYRAGAFQPLAKLALDHKLPAEINPAQVRCALTAVLKRLFVPETFTAEGCLTLGLVGNQQAALADYYSNTGSMYITSLAFLPLGLPATDPFWTEPFADWTQRKAWSGQPFPKDYAVDY